MNTNTTWIHRIIATITGLAGFGYLYATIVTLLQVDLTESNYRNISYIFYLLGAVWGYLYLFSKFKKLTTLSNEQLGGVIFGGLLGLLGSALFCVPLLLVPSPYNHLMGLLTTVGITYLTASTFGKRNEMVTHLVEGFQTKAATVPTPSPIVEKAPQEEPAEEQNKTLGSVDGVYQAILLDTSVIIDGRIKDISKTGFLNAKLLIPKFVLNELQYIADSPDPIRRKRGRRGLEVLNALQTECPLPFEIMGMDVSEVKEVDSKLVALGKHLTIPIMTNDYNLNKVAGLQGVNVLNINDLANSVKAAYLPGEKLRVKVIQAGREPGQGIGYLEDGTMVVVENGTEYMNKPLSVEVTKVLQTSAGKMVFAKLPDELMI